jgi:hypothetical protein
MGWANLIIASTDILLKFADPSLQQRERVTEAITLQAESAKEISI